LTQRIKEDLTGEGIATEKKSPVLVVGQGNPLRSDDGIGLRIAQELRACPDNSTVEIMECNELTPETAERIRHAALVIFVDAAIDGFPGEVRHHRLDGFGAEISRRAFSHGQTPDSLIALARNLYAAFPEAHLFTVCGSSFRYGETFSSEVARVFPLVVSEIEKLLRAATHV
jgi:hydrogenase maturation protease